MKDKKSWVQTFVYGANKPLDRRPLWQTLFNMKAKVLSHPWILYGDFNVIRSVAEKWGSDCLNSYELEFVDCLNNLEVTNLNFSDCFFTWNNNSEGFNFVARKFVTTRAGTFLVLTLWQGTLNARAERDYTWILNL